MAIITISRQLGSLGRQVANLAASGLGYRLVWRELWDQAALRIGRPELALAAIDELGLLGICPSPKICHMYQAEVQKVLLEYADHDNSVLLGRAGQAVLRDRPNTLHVRVIAPIELRIQRVASAQSISIEQANAQIEASDRFRRNYLHRYYHLDWDDPNLYDLIINTSRLSLNESVNLIIQAANNLPVRPLSLPSLESPLDVC